jgi:hypothetical protein
MILAHLVGDHWRLGEFLLYGGAGVGLVCGTGLFLWGRRERQGIPPPPSPEAVEVSREPLIKCG